MTIDAATARLIKILAQMAQRSDEALEAGSLGNEEVTRVAVDCLRELQSKLNQIEPDVRNSVDKLEYKRQEISAYLVKIKQAENFIHSWRNRYKGLLDYESLASTSQGRHAIIDYVLPHDWNFKSDLFLLFSEEELIFVPELINRSQKRILVVDQVDEIKIDVTSCVTVAETAEKVRRYITKLTTPIPQKVAALKNEWAQLKPDQWEGVKNAFRDLNLNDLTAKILGEKWMTQGLKNLESIAKSANLDHLKSAVKGMPVVIISPGPSLDKNIHILKQLKGKAILMAAAQSARALHNAGIIPDLIVVADPGNIAYFLDGVDIKEVEALIVGVSCNPEFYRLPFRKIIAFNANYEQDKWISNIFNDNLPVLAAGSVSLDCFYIAKYFECSHMIMVGLDLALSDNKNYSSHSANGESSVVIDEKTKTLRFTNVPHEMEKVFLDKGLSTEKMRERVSSLPGYYGGTVPTRANYFSFHGRFVQLAEVEATMEKPIPLINCTEGGAFIEGFEHTSLQNAIEKYKFEYIVKIRDEIENYCNTVDFEFRLKSAAKARVRIKYDINKSLNLARKCKKLALIKNPTLKHQLNLEKNEKDLITSVSKTPFISFPNVNQVKMAMEIHADAENLKEVNSVAIMLYDLIEKSAMNVLKIIS